ncbi:DoxX family protein [Candidatus Nanohalococcus occultus]|uniref:Membrane protein, DoxD family n=1 Tax=Candidatus Nanohalococcus occultus TaxID=2978047 RepID=A0ABY8CDF0_9ARCH|nr:Putative membrane protein, DoxD family [Candidatus Nanohaloarchaeota archaeon SVXNc]
MAYEQLLLMAGRALMGGYFAFTGINHFMSSQQMAGWIESKGLPAPEALNYLAGGLLLFAGLGMVTGAAPAVSWGALTVFVAATTVLFHDFWSMEGEEKQNQMVHFLKNIGLLGGLLLFGGLVASGEFGTVLLELSLL